MSSVPHNDVAGTDHAHDDHAHHPTGIMRWITTTNHKDIGTLYLWFSFTMFIVGGIMAMLIRAELFEPGLQIFEPERFNQMTSLHGLIMVFGALMPGAFGFGLSQILLFIAVVKCIRGGEKAPAKPWEGGTTLEWTLPSPPPYHTFETPPVVK